MDPKPAAVASSSTDKADIKDNRRLRTKTDLVVLPCVVISMTLAFLDKASQHALSNTTNDLSTNTASTAKSILGSAAFFYFGYLAMELPSLWLITKVPIGNFIGTRLVLWGAAICLMSACHNFAGLATIRVLLASSRPPCFPQQGVFGDILSYAIGNIKGSLSTWKYIFIIYGAGTILTGFVVLFALPDSPQTAWFFSEEEKKQTGVDTNKRFASAQILEALKDHKCWCVWACGIGYAIANAGITNFNPLIIAGYGFSQTKSVLMATPQAAVAMVAGAALTTISLFVQNLRCLFWILSALVGLAGAVMVHTLDVNAQRDASLAGVYIMGFYNVPWVFMLSLNSSNTAGATKKSFVGVAVAVCYAIGNIIGPQLFLSSQAPRYPLGISAMMFAFALMAASGLVYCLLCVSENKRRNAKYGVPDDMLQAGLEQEKGDSTDWENKAFRYTY
ncbi:putative transporter [Colletotrichum tanaceti]|uniref:Putative transporter n=1 Tax=Colletotrichum tanaceti TaxID=1306861 RepID=A0A4U6XRP3_9PEZI|nr:putative transporter [Colletotrichum tanaceti]